VCGEQRVARQVEGVVDGGEDGELGHVGDLERGGEAGRSRTHADAEAGARLVFRAGFLGLALAVALTFDQTDLGVVGEAVDRRGGTSVSSFANETNCLSRVVAFIAASFHKFCLSRTSDSENNPGRRIDSSR
jgi:hypothetical protein